MFSKLFSGRGKAGTSPEAPAGARVYAIGDIHGRLDLLRILHRKIDDDAAAHDDKRRILIYLGDYVDRGSSSRQVIDCLLDDPLPGFNTVYLSGNHEEMMLSFLDDVSIGPMWMINGGDATLQSYGIGEPQGDTVEDRQRELQSAFVERIPRAHIEFLRGLRVCHVEGDYLFVHAGVAPGKPLEDQDPEDLLWIREEFLNSDADHGKCVVHGHSIVAEPDIRGNRIAIDTGAYFSNILTCVVLDGSEQTFLQTEP